MNIETQPIHIVCARAKFVPLFSIRETATRFHRCNLYRCCGLRRYRRRWQRCTCYFISVRRDGHATCASSK